MAKSKYKDGYIIVGNKVRAVYTIKGLKGSRYYDRKAAPGGKVIYTTKKQAERHIKKKTKTTSGRKRRRRRKYRSDGSWYWQYYWSRPYARIDEDLYWDYPGRRRYISKPDSRYKKYHSGYAKWYNKCEGRTKNECGSLPKCHWTGSSCHTRRGASGQGEEVVSGPVNWHDQAYFGY